MFCLRSSGQVRTSAVEVFLHPDGTLEEETNSQDSYLFETLCVSCQNVLTHQFLDQRMGASVQLGQEAEAETLQEEEEEACQHADGNG